jgi:flagellar biosynthesis chaperone FliJ
MLPTINHNVNVRVSKASMLQKAASYISTLTSEQRQQLDEQAELRQQVESLKQTVFALQGQLPSTDL